MPGSGIKPNTLTRDPESVNAYKNDPLVNYRKITARLGWEMIKSFEETPDIVGKFTLPVIVQKGSVDISVTGIEELKDAFKSEILTYIRRIVSRSIQRVRRRSQKSFEKS